jgi:hypothetical protein
VSDSLVAPRPHWARPLPAPEPAPVSAPEEPGDEAACLAFGYLRGARDRALNIVFHRAREGDTVTFPYSWLGPTRLHPSVGLRVLFVGSELYLVTVRGRNLTIPVAAGIDLHERGLVRHRVTWVREVSGADGRAAQAGACVVDRIEIAAVTPEQAAEALDIRFWGAD